MRRLLIWTGFTLRVYIKLKRKAEIPCSPNRGMSVGAPPAGDDINLSPRPAAGFMFLTDLLLDTTYSLCVLSLLVGSHMLTRISGESVDSCKSPGSTVVF